MRDPRLSRTLQIYIAWAAISLAPIWKYLSRPKALAASIFALLALAAEMYWLDRLNRSDRQISLKAFALLFLVFVIAFAVLYPASLKRPFESRSDREDAIRIELLAIQRHQYPYDARTFRGNLPTPLPGALLLAAPFFALKHIAWQNLFWLALFFGFSLHFFCYRATAFFLLTVFLLCSPATLSDFVYGGDYLTNFFYLAIAIALFHRSLRRSLHAAILAALFLGVALSSRSLYLVVLIPLGILTLQQTTKRRAAILCGVIAAAFTAVTLPVFTPHPLAHLLQQLSQNSTKLRYLPPALHAEWTLPFLGLAAICASFFIRMDVPRLFLLFSISLFVILAPPIIALALHQRALPYECSYLSVSALAFSLWALSRYEQETTYQPQTTTIPPRNL
jgi:hypothetical protein